MKKKRPRRQPTEPPPAASAPPRQARVRPAGPLQYKVAELSTVDEGALERCINEWTAQGWNLDGVQFAMRESSKRPAMAFVFFTREGAEASHDAQAARERLRRLAEAPSEGNVRSIGPVSAHERLTQLAADEDEGEDA